MCDFTLCGLVLMLSLNGPADSSAGTFAVPVTTMLLALPADADPQQAPQKPQPPEEATKTFKAPSGKTYRYSIQPGVAPEKEEEFEPKAKKAAGADGFAGTARKAAKTSLATAPVEAFATVGDLLDNLLKGQSVADNDRAMRGKIRSTSSPRVAEELRNVKVPAFIYATKQETDNDFHLLLGTDPAISGTRRIMTSEVSGLPTPPNSTLAAARKQFKDFFLNPSTGLALPPPGRYVVFAEPIPVTVTGSVFFDLDHKPGEVGTHGIVAPTVWEIHPVSQIEFR